jgi:hypothetical protein
VQIQIQVQVQFQETGDLILSHQQTNEVPLPIPSAAYIPSALIAGGFLLPANAYDPYVFNLQPSIRRLIPIYDYEGRCYYSIEW